MLGPTIQLPTGLDLTLEGVILTRNGQLLASAGGAEALGNLFFPADHQRMVIQG